MTTWVSEWLGTLNARRYGLTVLAGAPGTGKTTLLRSLAHWLVDSHVFYFMPAARFASVESGEIVTFWAILRVPLDQLRPAARWGFTPPAKIPDGKLTPGIRTRTFSPVGDPALRFRLGCAVVVYEVALGVVVKSRRRREEAGIEFKRQTLPRYLVSYAYLGRISWLGGEILLTGFSFSSV